MKGLKNMLKSNNPSAIRSQKQITEALLSLMEKYQYSQISVKQIILETDLVRKTFYRNFSSKDDVLNSYIDEIIFAYTDALLDETEPLDIIFDFFEKNRNLVILLHKNDLMHLLLYRLNKVIPKVSKTADANRNLFKKMFGDLNDKYLIAFNVGALWNVLYAWVEGGMKEPLEDIKDTLRQYINNKNIIQL